MKNILLILFLFIAGLIQAQERTVELIKIISLDIDTIYCDRGRTIEVEGEIPSQVAVEDTITSAYFKIQKVSIDNGTSIPSVSVDTILIDNNGCPADSAEIARRLLRDIVEYSNRATNAMSRAFKLIRSDRAEWVQNENVFEDFTGVNPDLEVENIYFSSWEGRYVIIDLSDNSRVVAGLIRLPSGRYRLEDITNSSNRYVMVPQNNGGAFLFRDSLGNVHQMFLDDTSNNRRPVYREIGYLDGTDQFRIIRIR